MEILPAIHRLGNGTANSYFIEEGGSVTVIDTGMPGLFNELRESLQAIGLDIGSVRAVLLTHAHSDHLGFAERIRKERGVPVWVEEDDAALARGEVKAIRDSRAQSKMSLGSFLSFLWYGMTHGALRTPHVTEVSTFGDGATLDVPGEPRVILVPGHTAGSAALHMPSRNALFAGDSIVTRNVVSGYEGPQLAPFGADIRQAFDSVRRLENVDARYLLPGHGQAWTGGVAAAVAEVRRGGAVLRK